jgi:hypothetical protein
VTPFTPTDWKLTFDGEAVSLRPSIGNWSLPCRSHYVIENGRVVKAGPWSDEQVSAERERDRRAKARYYGVKPSSPKIEAASSDQSALARARGLWSSMKQWWAGR